MDFSGLDEDLNGDDRFDAIRIRNLAIDGKKAEFDAIVVEILRPSFPVDEWFKCLVALHGLTDRFHADYYKPLLGTENLGRKRQLLAHAIRQSFPDNLPDHGEAKKVALHLIMDSPELIWADAEREEGTETVLHLAAKSGVDVILETLILKAKDSPEEFTNALKRMNQGRTPLGTAIFWGKVRAVGLLIEQIDCLDELGDRDDLLIFAVEKKQDQIFRIILNRFPDLLKGDAGFLRVIIKEGFMTAWDMALASGIDVALLEEPDLLHEAIEYRRVLMVQAIIDRQPQLAAVEDKRQRWPLSLNTHSVDNDATPEENAQTLREREQIREIILPAILRELDPSSARTMFVDAGNKLDQISLNLSIFNQRGHDFCKFLDLIDHEQTKGKPVCFKIPFEPVLKSVRFPDFERLRCHEETSQTTIISKSVRRNESSKILRLQEEPAPIDSVLVSGRRDEVSKVLIWLKDVKDGGIKNVRKIYHLVVPDYLDDPHTEEAIEEAIKPFKVEVFDWRRLDLSIDSVEAGAPTVRHLSLYSSGNKAALSHWFGPDGIRKLTQLRHVELVIYKHNVSLSRAKDLREAARSGLRRWRDERLEHERNSGKYSYNVSLADLPVKNSTRTQSWNENADQLSYKLTGLEPFLTFYRAFQQKRESKTSSFKGARPFQRVKVAIIDNGIDDFSFEHKISHGVSFVYHGDEESNWWLASNSHGTHMAKFVNQIDPFCELHIAKVGNKSKDIVAERVTKAIDWAMKKNVDIISMSFVLENESEKTELESMIEKAFRQDILLFCSTADTERRRKDALPACYKPATLGIASRERGLGAEDWTSDGNADYHFLGKDFATDDIHYIPDTTCKVSGSSVSTALAAGVASLVLACDRYANAETPSRRTVIHRIFEKMKGEDKTRNKYVQPANLFPNSLMDEMTGAEWIESTFK